jgi:hypothetical protein
MTVSSFYANNYNLTFMNAVAKAANVNVSMVNLISVVYVGVARRLLHKHNYGTGDLVLTFVVQDVENIDPQAVHHHAHHVVLLRYITKNRVNLVFSVTWEPSHVLHVISA